MSHAPAHVTAHWDLLLLMLLRPSPAHITIQNFS